MKNSDFIRNVIHCKDCIHRGTWRCLMNQYNPDFDEYYDMTDDEGFCHLGEKDDYLFNRGNARKLRLHNAIYPGITYAGTL